MRAIFNTSLTENAVLAFEYGYSVGAPDALTVWEAQFGDFLNTAQAIFDQFIICGEDRWLFESNLVLLLPHGVDGGGPDHATAHPERAAGGLVRGGNIQVVNLATPANYFHALRRQVKAPWRKPLVVLAPKTLLRHAGARSPLADLAAGFQPVIAGTGRDARRVVAATGQGRRPAGGGAGEIPGSPRSRWSGWSSSIRWTARPWLPRWHRTRGRTWCGRRRSRRISGISSGWTAGWRTSRGVACGWSGRPASPSASAGPKVWDDRHLQAVIDAALDLG